MTPSAQSKCQTMGRHRSASKAIRAFLIAAQDGLCAKCGEPLKGDFEVHHVVAFCDGGETVPINEQILCPRCHHSTPSYGRVKKN